MKIRNLEEISKDLERIMAVSHPGNMQLQISDKCLLYYAERITDYDDEDNEFMTAMFLSLEYYGEHHDAVVRMRDDEIYTSTAGGDLSDKLFDFIEDELQDHMIILWNAIDKWSLYES